MVVPSDHFFISDRGTSCSTRCGQLGRTASAGAEVINSANRFRALFSFLGEDISQQCNNVFVARSDPGAPGCE